MRRVNRRKRPYWLYRLHAALGENDLAFATLEQSFVERECFLAWFPVRRSYITSLESDPRTDTGRESVHQEPAGGGSSLGRLPARRMAFDAGRLCVYDRAWGQPAENCDPNLDHLRTGGPSFVAGASCALRVAAVRVDLGMVLEPRKSAKNAA